jgi:hypothetical protein
MMQASTKGIIVLFCVQEFGSFVIKIVIRLIANGFGIDQGYTKPAESQSKNKFKQRIQFRNNYLRALQVMVNKL